MQLDLFAKTTCAVCNKEMEQIEAVHVHHVDDASEIQSDVVCGEFCRIDYFINLVRKEQRP